MQTNKHWDDIFAQGEKNIYSRVKMPNLNAPVLNRALAHFGSVTDKTLIDLGCGNGAASLFFAYHGANVISVDFSEVAIKNLAEYCQNNGIENIKPVNLPAQEINKLGKADFIYGSMILHHLEPFDEFAKTLRQSIQPKGKGFFWENNARSKLMLWFRENLAGKLWVPKYGDPEEFPLTPDEVEILRDHFQVEIEIPELFYFRNISKYIFRRRFMKPFYLLDNYFYRFPALREHSYFQYLCLS